MRECVISMQNTLFSEAVAQALSGTGEFRVEQVLPGKTDDIFSLCRAAQADILLMEVSRADRSRARGGSPLPVRAVVR